MSNEGDAFGGYIGSRKVGRYQLGVIHDVLRRTVGERCHDRCGPRQRWPTQLGGSRAPTHLETGVAVFQGLSLRRTTCLSLPNE